MPAIACSRSGSPAAGIEFGIEIVLVPPCWTMMPAFLHVSYGSGSEMGMGQESLKAVMNRGQ